MSSIPKQSAVLHRNLEARPMIASAGRGPLLGGHKVAIDLSAGAGVTCSGNSTEPIKRAIISQLNLLPYAHAACWTTVATEHLAEMLLDHVGWYDGGVMFLNTGAEAVEGACKLAVQYSRMTDVHSGVQFIARRNSYHGNTFFTLALGDHPRKKNFTIVPGPEVWRLPQFGDCNLEEHERIARSMLSAARIANRVPIVVLETIGGTTVGIEPPTREYLDMIKLLCAKAGAILIFDEVLCGNYRVGDKFFAWQHYGVEPDIVCIGKGLAGGYFPLSAAIVSPRIRKGLGPQLWHSTTNQNHPLGCAAGVMALMHYEHTAEQRQALASALALEIERFDLGQCSLVDRVTGIGTLWGIHLAPTRHQWRGLRERLLEHRVAAYVEYHTFGTDKTSILLAPPYDMTPTELREGISTLVRVIEDGGEEKEGT